MSAITPELVTLAAELKQKMDELTSDYFLIPHHDEYFGENGKRSHNEAVVGNLSLTTEQGRIFNAKRDEFKKQYESIAECVPNHYRVRYLDKRFYDYYMAELHPKGA